MIYCGLTWCMYLEFGHTGASGAGVTPTYVYCVHTTYSGTDCCLSKRQDLPSDLKRLCMARFYGANLPTTFFPLHPTPHPDLFIQDELPHHTQPSCNDMGDPCRTHLRSRSASIILSKEWQGSRDARCGVQRCMSARLGCRSMSMSPLAVAPRMMQLIHPKSANAVQRRSARR